MKPAKLHPKEQQRLDALLEYEILDTLPEQEFDDLTLLASTICDAPIALFSLVDESRQWFKSRVGLDAEETHRDLAFCAHAIHEQEVFYVEDATKDDRFSDNPLVTGHPDIRFYAGTQILSRGGLPIGTLCVIDRKPRALSNEHKCALKALGRQLMSQLELRLLLKSEAKAKKRLSIANRKLDKLAKLKTQFLNHVSHEIRTPLNGILGLSTFLTERYPVKPDSREDSLESELDMIRTAASNLYEMVNHVLDISKIESGKMNRVDESIDLKVLIDDLTKINYSRAREKHILVTTKVEVDKDIELDRTKLLQILMNLFGNAIKFSPAHSKVSITVKVEDNKLSFIVSDSGKGIAKKDIQRIFEPFRQSDNHIGNDQPSSGLGLTIVKELTDFLGGKISVESDVGKGSKFIVTFPFVESVKASEQEAVNESVPELSNKKILLVEDNAVNQLVFKGFISPTNANLMMVSNASDSFEAVKSFLPDVIFLDIRMPGMSGFEILEKLREDSAIKNIPVAFLSGDVSPETIDKAKESNSTFLAKPIIKPTLYEYLRKTLSS
ncbi:MAG: response regulator [Gammaproteobacteria bacterium]|nr:response regulator [Gammaproteobacteria bacterium]